MGGYFPRVPVFAAFTGVKFGGYCLAGLTLMKFRPAITAGVLKIAGTRTALGVLIGPPLLLGMSLALDYFLPPSGRVLSVTSYALLCGVRVIVWALVINVFVKDPALFRSKPWTYAALGAVWSCLLDLSGVGLAFISPGWIPIC